MLWTMHNDTRWLLQEKYGLDKMPARLPVELKKDLARLKRGEPIAYVIGWVNFLDVKIDLHHKPLIPRVETELWTEKAIKRIPERKKVRVLDIFSGSGAIGLALAKARPNAHVSLAEFYSNALREMRHNAKLNGLSGQVKVIRSDVWKDIRGRYDYIFANPPYIPLARKKFVQKSVTKFEPLKAVFGGNDGMKFIAKFLSGLQDHLKPEGRAWMEFDGPDKAKLLPLVKKFGFRAYFLKDSFGAWRVAELYRK